LFHGAKIFTEYNVQSVTRLFDKNVMCLAIPGKITKISGREVLVEYPGENRRAFLGDDVKADLGDFVMVQMGVVVKKISAKEAKTSLNAWHVH